MKNHNTLITLALLAALATPMAFAGDDTPFFVFQCIFGKTKSGKLFTLKLKNDDKPEVLIWKSEDSKGTEIRFEKIDHTMARVKVSTGMLMLGGALPDHYTFTAALALRLFDFSFAQRMVGVPLEPTGLVCQKVE